MSCNISIPLQRIIDDVAEDLAGNYISVDNPFLNESVLTDTTFRGDITMDTEARNALCAILKTCGITAIELEWLDRPTVADMVAVSEVVAGEVVVSWKDLDTLITEGIVGKVQTTDVLDSLGVSQEEINTDIRNELDALPFEDGVLADTFVTATANGTGAVARTQQEVNADSVSAKGFGAKGNGVTDDTKAIQKAIDHVASLGGGTVTVPDGTYMIKADNPDSSASHYLHDEGGIALKDNVHLKLSAATTLKAIPTNERRYNVVRSFNKKNVAISGGRILGERDQHIAGGQVGEWGYGIAVTGSEEVSISDIDVEKCYGDGLNLQLAYINDVPISPKGVYIDKVRSLHNRRQGMSIEAGYDVFITRSEFSHTGGTEPASGIDIEPWSPDAVVKNILIDGCRFVSNAKKGVVVGGSGDISNVRVINNYLEGNQSGSGAGQITVYTPQSIHTTRDIEVRGNTVIGGGNCNYGILVFDSENVNVTDNILTDCMLGLSGFTRNKNITYTKNIVNVGTAAGAVQFMNDDDILDDSTYQNINISDNIFNFLDAIVAGIEPPVFYIRGIATKFSRNKLIGLAGIRAKALFAEIKDNQLHNFSYYGLKVLGDDSRVDGNIMYNVSYSQYGETYALGISAKNVIVTKNIFRNDSPEQIPVSLGTHKITSGISLAPTIATGCQVIDNDSGNVAIVNWSFVELNNTVASSKGFEGLNTPASSTRPIGFRFYNTTSKKQLINTSTGWLDLLGNIESYTYPPAPEPVP